MILNNKIKIGVFLLIGILLMVSLVSATYSRSNPNYGLFESYVDSTPVQFDKSMCEAGQDFIIQIAPFGCTPAVVRSDLLEEQNVPIFCQLGATKINPLIDVEAIESISFTGEYPEEVSGIGFHPAKAALGVKENLNFPVLNNIGYVVIVLKEQRNASAMPDFVEGTLTAKIKYDIKNAFGIGDVSFYLPEFNDKDWEEKYIQYGFWNGEFYLRADEIDDEGAMISIYSDIRKISSVSLKKGETSEKIYMPGFDCLAGLEVKLDDIENPATRVKLRLNGDIVEVKKGGWFLENKCEVKGFEKAGLIQKTTIKCKDEKAFDLKIEPKIKLNVGGVEKGVDVGDIIYDFEENDKKIFLGYFGETSDGKQFIVPVVSTAHTKEDFLDSFIYKSLPGFIKVVASKTDVLAANVIKSLFTTVYGSTATFVSSIATETYMLPLVVKKDQTAELLETNFRLAIGGSEALRAIEESHPPEIEFLGFAGSQDKELDEKAKEYYEKAIDDYDTILESFSGEKESVDDKETFGERALYNKISLSWHTGQKKTVIDSCEEFKKRYPNSDKNLNYYCDDEYKLSSSVSASRSVMINGRFRKISFEGIYEPSEKEYSVEILVRGANKNYTGLRTLQKNEKVYVSGDEFIFLNELEKDHAIFDVRSVNKSIGVKLTYSPDSLKINLRDYQIIGENRYKIGVDKINLKKIAKISVIPNIDNVGTEANFSFKVGIEKRAIKLSPEKTKEIIEGLNKTIQQWTEISEGLGIVVKGLKTACLGVGAGLTIKNFFANTGGKAIARQEIMRSDGGWYERCSNLVSSGKYNSMEKCFLENADEIDNDVDAYYSVLTKQNEEIKKLQEDYETSKFLTETQVDTEEFRKKYIPIVKKELEETFEGEGEINVGGGEMVEVSEILEMITPDTVSIEQARSLQLNSRIDSDMIRKQLDEGLIELYNTNKQAAERTNFVEKINEKQGLSGVGFDWGREKDSQEKRYDGGTSGPQGFGNISNNSYVQGFGYGGERYLLELNEDKRGEYSVKAVYNLDGYEIEDSGDLAIEINKKFSFKKFDETSYKNPYTSSLSDPKKPVLRYYETEPYKGLPAIVPFDLVNGWYASISQTLPVSGGIRSYDESGRVSSLYVCNVWKNGREENKGGDDKCTMINLGTGQPYDEISGLSELQARKIVGCAIDAVKQALRVVHKSGRIEISTICDTFYVEVGKPAVDIPDMQCQDFMSPKDCNLLFNVCDPVVCPSSRCDFGGAYPVKDVIQSGIIGSIVLCLPNFGEGIYIPVCLTGVKAGIDGLLSIFTSYRDCLQHSLDTGEMIGVCDEIYSIYMCEFLWRQALPLAKIALPKMMELIMGQNVRGGGEYLGVASAWDNADKSVNYFTQYYAASSYKAFKARTAEEVGGEICKMYVSGVYPESGNLLDSLIEPDSPPQFHGRFDEILFTTATVPPVSHYKVFYHIFAGKDSGAYYKVYLKGVPETSFYQDISSIRIVASGYIVAGGYASETKDFTAPSGYKEMCIMVNNQEECGFKQVSTAFAVNYIKDEYMASQARETDIKTEIGCIAGSASAYSLLSPSIQGGAEEIINPAIYNRGIIRICATDNPGKGTDDAYVGGEGARWVEVGYCDNEKIKCWLDTKSVKDVIRTTTIEEDVLEEVTEDYVKILKNEGNYLSDTDFDNVIKETEELIEDSKFEDAINKVNDNFGKVFLNREKAHLLFLRGNVYSLLSPSLQITADYEVPYQPHTEGIFKSYYNINAIINGEEDLPSFWEPEDEDAFCARYSRIGAEEFFGLKYHWCSVWCREFVEDVIWKASKRLKSNNDYLEKLEEEGKLKPGMIVGVYYPNSKYNGKKWDCWDKEVIIKYTHNLLYLGKNYNGELVFAEYIYREPRIRTLDKFEDDGLIAMAVFGAPDKLNSEKNVEVCIESDFP